MPNCNAKRWASIWRTVAVILPLSACSGLTAPALTPVAQCVSAILAQGVPADATAAFVAAGTSPACVALASDLLRQAIAEVLATRGR